MLGGAEQRREPLLLRVGGFGSESQLAFDDAAQVRRHTHAVAHGVGDDVDDFGQQTRDVRKELGCGRALLHRQPAGMPAAAYARLRAGAMSNVSRVAICWKCMPPPTTWFVTLSQPP